VYAASKRKPAANFAEMSGAPGSGKSTLANLLAQSLNGIVINHDLLKSFFLENYLGASFNRVAKLTYNLQWTLAEDVIKQGRTTVIIDSTCNYEKTLTQGTALAERYGYEYKYVESKVNDIDLLDQRLQSRVSLRSQRKGVNIPPPDASSLLGADFDHRAQYKNWMENPCRPIRNAIVVDSTRNPQKCLGYVLEQIFSTTSSGAISEPKTPTSPESSETSVIVRAQE
jgi:predicted kinase